MQSMPRLNVAAAKPPKSVIIPPPQIDQDGLARGSVLTEEFPDFRQCFDVFVRISRLCPDHFDVLELVGLHERGQTMRCGVCITQQKLLIRVVCLE